MAQSNAKDTIEPSPGVTSLPLKSGISRAFPHKYAAKQPFTKAAGEGVASLPFFPQAIVLIAYLPAR
jgi:hypothetical protein